MNELIKIEINENQEQIVSARELHEKLGINKRFSAWFSDQLSRLSMIEGFDYTPYLEVHPQNHQNMQDYHITLDIAKHLSMISGGDKSHEIRQYFIQVEKAWNNPDQIMARALQVSNRVLLEYKQQLQLVQPKVDFHDAVVGSNDTIDMGQVAKVLNCGVGRNKLFEILREKKVLRDNNEPFQSYCDRGWFRMVESKYQLSNGDIRINIKTVVFQKGVDGIRKLLKEKML
jgi:anti-repressor protein